MHQRTFFPSFLPSLHWCFLLSHLPSLSNLSIPSSIYTALPTSHLQSNLLFPLPPLSHTVEMVSFVPSFPFLHTVCFRVDDGAERGLTSGVWMSHERDRKSCSALNLRHRSASLVEETTPATASQRHQNVRLDQDSSGSLWQNLDLLPRFC